MAIGKRVMRGCYEQPCCGNLTSRRKRFHVKTYGRPKNFMLWCGAQVQEVSCRQIARSVVVAAETAFLRRFFCRNLCEPAMTLTQLRYLIAIADSGLNITTAAER